MSKLENAPTFKMTLEHAPGAKPLVRIGPGGGGVLPYMGYIGMCGPKGYGFSAVLVINRVSIIAIFPPLWS